MKQLLWNQTKNILCIRPDNMGDVLMTTPAFKALKQQDPERRLTLLTSKAGSVIARYIPEIDDVITVDVPWVQTAETTTSEQLLSTISLLKNRKFDAAIIFTVFSQNPLPSALLSFLADIPLRLAYCHEKPWQLLTDWVPDPEPADGIRHEVQRQLDLVATLGAHTADTKLSLKLPSLAEEAALKDLALAGVDTLRPWIILHPGASSAKRRYPAAGFIEVGKELRDREGLQIVITGSKDEAELADKIATDIGEHAHSIAGKVPFETFLGVIALAPILISNNTGPVHIAAALQTPVIDLYALTNPQHTPWEVASKVLYFPVEKQYLPVVSDQIPGNATELTSPEDIVQAALELLAINTNLTEVSPTAKGLRP